MALRFMNDGHDVQTFLSPKPGPDGRRLGGDGLIEKIDDWKKVIGKADMTVLLENSKYVAELEPYFQQGYPILGANRKSAELELDRQVGQDVLRKYKIDVADNEVFTSYDKAISYVKANPEKCFVSKPWGGSEDKALSYVSKNAADMIFMLEDWKKLNKLAGAFMLQECISGCEMAVGGWFGPGGWSNAINENWEEKRRMNDGLGENTGEMGTVLRYVKHSELFDEVLEPVTDYLHKCKYVGYVDMNCIIDEQGKPWPLEFTMRFGWPHINIAMALHKGDSADWLYDLIHGRDSLAVSKEIAAGIVMKRPSSSDTPAPIYGVTVKNQEQLCFQGVMDKVSPMMFKGEVKNIPAYCTTNDYVMVVTGTGATVDAAARDAYRATWEINWPGSREFRTDIGKHLKKDLPKLQSYGFAEGLKYS